MLLLWALLSVSLLGYVLRYGHNQPWGDEWEFVPTLTGNASPVSFLMHPHNEHRLPLPRLIYLALWETTHDFRAGMVLQVLLLSVVAYRGMRLAAWLRGSAHWVDAFFPLSLLHVGHWENLLMGYQLCFVLASALVCSVLELALRVTSANADRTTILAAVATMGLVLSGGFGIVLAMPIAVWVGVVIVMSWKKHPLVFAAAILPLLATFAYCGYYFATYDRPPAHPPFELKNWAASLQVAGQFVAFSFGIGVGPIWFIVLPLLLLALGGVIVHLRRHSEQRFRIARIVAIAVGVILLSLAIGAGRGGFGSEMGLWPRYSVLGWPLLAALYFSALLVRGAIEKWLPLALAVATALAFLPNSIAGVQRGKLHDEWLGNIEKQLREGESVEAILEHSLTGTGQEERARRGIPMLSAAKIGPFAAWNAPP